MPTQDDVNRYTQVATRVLMACKKIQPSFYSPAANPDLPATWGYVMACKPYPELVYLEAVAAYYANTTGDERPGVGDIVHYAGVVRDRWEGDPDRRQLLRQHRQQRQDERDRQIEAGTFRGSRRSVTPPQTHVLGPGTSVVDLGQGLGDMPW